jgi:hypothetical protein
MAAPINTLTVSRSVKRKVDLGAPGRRGSRIRRAPPPPSVKETSPEELRERERRTAIAGVTALALVISLVVLGIAQNWDFSLADYTIRM